MALITLALALLAHTSPAFAVQADIVAIPGAVEAPAGSSPPQKTSIEYLRQHNRVQQVPVAKVVSPAQKAARDLVRHGIPVPTAVKIAATQTGSVQATGQPYDFQFNAPVTIGSTTFLLDFDTGSSDLWVFSEQLPASERGSHTLYQDTGEPFPPQYNEAWAISYVDGTGASGNVWGDAVTVGGVTATLQAVEAATSVASTFVTRVPDGLLGLAFDSINQCYPYQCFTFMHQLAPTLPKDLFTATLRKGKPGTYDFGFIDPAEYTGALGYTPSLNGSGYWGLQPAGYSVGTAAKVASKFFTIADTGTSLTFLPPAIVKAYYAKVKGAALNKASGFYLFPCSSTTPNFNLFLANGHKLTLPGSYINIGVYSGTTCLGGLQSDTGFPNSILGDSFLKSQFVVFDRSVPRLGFAQQKGLPSS